ncbi:MAG: N-acetyl-gamma-glutamyl-phosphate reductase [Chthoniobacterales bacterium]
MQLDAIILGASGYGGGELIRWLSQHPNVASIRGTSRSLAGKPFAEAHPNLRGIVEGNFAARMDWRELEESAEPVVFSALPHGELAKLLPTLEEEWREAGLSERLLLLDLSADFRSSGDFVYGMPEWNRAALSGAKRIACPGCFATALQIGLLPLRDLEVGFLAASAVTGSSGSGLAASAGTHHPTRANDFRAYKVLTHQHLAEVRIAMQSFGLRGQLSFVPQSGPFVRGIFATMQFALPRDLSETQLRERAARVFADAPFIRMVETSPRVAAVAGSNFADVSLAVADGSAAVLVALDNLGKGMAGQAVQAMNLALGLPETAGLRTAGRFPG